MPDAPKPTPLTAEEEAAIKERAAYLDRQIDKEPESLRRDVCIRLLCDDVRRLLATLDTSRESLAAARKVVADVIRWLECGAEAMAKTARPGDSRFGEALAEVVAAVAARDSGKASGGGTDAR